MTIFQLTIFFLSIFLPGYLISSLIFKKDKISLFLILPLSYGIGAFFITMQLFLYLFVFRLSFSYIIFYLILLAENLWLFFLVYKREILPNINTFQTKRKFILDFYQSFSAKKVVSIIIVFLIFLNLAFLTLNALSRPVMTYDSMDMWSYKAKILFYENKVEFNPEDSLYLGGGRFIHYPQHLPLLQYWLHVNLGEYNDLLVNLIFIFYFISLLSVMFYFLKEYVSCFYGFIFTFFLSSMPLFFYHGFNAYADLTLSFYVFIAFAFLYSWLKEKNSKHLLLSGIFWGISFWIKDTAILYILPGLAVLTLYLIIERIRILNIFKYIFFIILPVFPWIMFKITYDFGVSNVESGIGFHPEVINSFFTAMFLTNNWNIFWYIILVVLLLNIKKIIINKELLWSWIFVFMSLAVLLFTYLFTERYQFALDHTALSRNIMIIVPITVFLTGLWFRGEEKIKQVL